MNKIFRKLAPFIALAAGVIFLVMGIISVQKHNSYTKTTATITTIERIEAVSADENDDFKVTVSYTVDGREYSSDLGEYKSSMNVGDSVEIMYDPANPDSIIAASNLSTVIYFAVSALGFFGGVVAIIKSLA